MAHHQVVDVGDGLQIWRVAVNVSALIPVKWFPCHRYMVHPQVADGSDSLQM